MKREVRERGLVEEWFLALRLWVLLRPMRVLVVYASRRFWAGRITPNPYQKAVSQKCCNWVKIKGVCFLAFVYSSLVIWGGVAYTLTSTIIQLPSNTDGSCMLC